LGAHGETEQPLGGVSCVRRPDHRYASIADLEQSTPDSGGTHMPVVEVVALDKEVEAAKLGSVGSKLGPETAIEDREVQIEHGLSLDADLATDQVVGCVELREPYNRSEIRKFTRNAGAPLPHVSVYRHIMRHVGISITTDLSQKRGDFVSSSLQKSVQSAEAWWLRPEGTKLP
jgi:hypothetical protein